MFLAYLLCALTSGKSVVRAAAVIALQSLQGIWSEATPGVTALLCGLPQHSADFRKMHRR